MPFLNDVGSDTESGASGPDIESRMMDAADQDLDESAGDELEESAGTEDQSDQVEDEATPDESQADADEVVEGDADSAPPADAPATDAVAEYTPMTFTNGREDVPMTGVYDNPDGSGYIHPDAKEQVRQAFQQAWMRENQDKKEFAAIRRSYNEMKATQAKEVVEARAKLAWFEKTMLECNTPEKIAQLAYSFHEKLPELRAEIKVQEANAILARANAQQQPDPYQQQEQEGQLMTKTLKNDIIGNLRMQEAYKGQLTRDQWERFGERLWNNRQSLFRKATPQDATKNFGIQPGQLVFDRDIVNQELQYALEMAGKAQVNQAQLKEAKNFNGARVNQPSIRKVPPMGGARTPGQNPGSTPRRPQRPLSWAEQRDAALREVMNSDDGSASMQRGSA